MEEFEPHRLHGPGGRCGGQHGRQRHAGQSRRAELTFLHGVGKSCRHAGPVVELAGRLLRLDDAGVGPVEKLQNPLPGPAGNHNARPIQDEEEAPVGVVPRAELVPDSFVAVGRVVRREVPHRRPPQMSPQQLLVVVVLLGIQVEPRHGFHFPFICFHLCFVFFSVFVFVFASSL